MSNTTLHRAFGIASPSPVIAEIRALPEQSPSTWPRYGAAGSVAERIAHAAMGYPTEADGDALAIARGPLARIAEIVR